MEVSWCKPFIYAVGTQVKVCHHFPQLFLIWRKIFYHRYGIVGFNVPLDTIFYHQNKDNRSIIVNTSAKCQRELTVGLRSQKVLCHFYCKMLCIARTMLSQNVCPSVRPSHANWRQNGSKYQTFLQPSNDSILVLQYQTVRQYSNGDALLTSASNAREVWKIAILDQYLRNNIA